MITTKGFRNISLITVIVIAFYLRPSAVMANDHKLEKVDEVRYWREFAGQVFVNGELWRAVSEFPLAAGDGVVVQQVDRLTVTVIPVKRLTWHNDSING